jgi:hypothetical protein
MLTYALHHGRSTRPVLRLVPDESYRIEWPDIGLSDLANLTRNGRPCPNPPNYRWRSAVRG